MGVGRSCPICGAALVPGGSRGRPKTYCSPRCRKAAELERRREERRQFWAELYAGDPPQADMDALAATEAVNEALAVASNAERALMLSHLPAELHEPARLSDPFDDESDLFGLLDDGAVRIRRQGAFAVAERYVDEELVGGGLLVLAEGCWRWVDDPGGD